MLSNFTVIGFYPDTAQRFSDVIKAETYYEAEQEALFKNHGLVVVGTVDGAVHMADISSPQIRE